MAWLLRKGPWEWTIQDSSEEADPLSLKTFSNTGSALSFLRDLQGDPFSMSVLRDLVVERHRASDLSNLDDKRLLEMVAWELESGRLRVAEVFRLLSLGGRAQAPVESDVGDAPFAPPPPPPKDEKTWVTFEVLDNETGKPVPGVTLEIKLPDGTTKKSKTDGSGLIEIKNITSGSCSIESMTDSDALEVLSIT
jgi:hypothetical protein